MLFILVLNVLLCVVIIGTPALSGLLIGVKYCVPCVLEIVLLVIVLLVNVLTALTELAVGRILAPLIVLEALGVVIVLLLIML